VLVGCGSRTSAEAAASTDEPIVLAECEAYAHAFETCFARLGAGASNVSRERVKTIREELRTPFRDEAERDARRRSCAEGAKRVADSCR
jgi:hypothetical protein